MSSNKSTVWSLSMSQDFSDRFDAYIEQLNKQNNTNLGRAEFGRFVFEAWEKRYLKLMETIKQQTEELEDLTPTKNKPDGTVKAG